MTVKELMDELSRFDPELTVSILIERGRGLSVSDEVYVGRDGDGVHISGEETDCQ
jgi:hypothetical protein